MSLPGGDSRWRKSSPFFPLSVLTPWCQAHACIRSASLSLERTWGVVPRPEPTAFKQPQCSMLIVSRRLPAPALWNEKRGRKGGSEAWEKNRQAKGWRNAKGGDPRSRTGIWPHPLLSKPASLEPSLCLLLTLFTRPAPVQKPSHLPPCTL